MNPQGGLNGLLRQIDEQDGSRGMLRLLMGNNLARDIKPDSAASALDAAESFAWEDFDLAAAQSRHFLGGTVVDELASARSEFQRIGEDLQTWNYFVHRADKIVEGLPQSWTAERIQKHAEMCFEEARDLCWTALKLPARLRQRLISLTRQYADSGLSMKSCQRRLDRELAESPHPSREALRKALRECEQDALIWQLQREFTAIALGPGDFNYTVGPEGEVVDDLIYEFRFYPFLASNLFLSSDSTGKGKLPEPFLFSAEILPTEPLQFKLPKKVAISQLQTVLKSASLTELAGLRPTRRMHLCPAAPKGGRERGSGICRQTDRGHFLVSFGQHGLMFDFEDRVSIDEDVLTVQWPVPLLPGIGYRLELDFVDQPDPQPQGFSTLETFTRTDRQRSNQVEDDFPNRPKLLPSSQEVKHPWVGVPWTQQQEGMEEQIQRWRIPVIDANSEAVSARVSTPLRLLAVIDEESLKRLPKASQGNAAQKKRFLNRITSMPMKEAILYWTDVLTWIERERALERLVQRAPGFDGPPALRSIFEEIAVLEGLLDSADEDRNQKDEDWEREFEAWKRLTHPQAEVKAADFGVESIQRALATLETLPALVLMAQTSRSRVEELLRDEDLKDALEYGAPPSGNADLASKMHLALAVGQASREGVPYQSQVKRSNSATDPFAVYPGEYAQWLDRVNLELVSASPVQARSASHQRFGVRGDLQQIVYKQESEGLQACCPKEFTNLLKRICGPSNPPGAQALRKDIDVFQNAVLLEMRRLSNAEAAVLPQGMLAPLSLRALRALGLLYATLGEPDDPKYDCIREEKYLSELPLNLKTATLTQVKHLPGSNRWRAGQLLRRGIRTREELGNSLDELPFDSDDFHWLEWFVIGEGEKRLGQNGIPFVEPDEFMDVLIQRMVAVDDRLIKVTMTLNQLAALVKQGSSAQAPLLRQGGNPAQKRLHGRIKAGTTPVTVVLPQRLVGQGSQYAVLGNRDILSRGIADGDGGRLTLSEIVHSLTQSDTPLGKDVLAESKKRDKAFHTKISLRKVAFEFSDLQATDSFTPISGEPLTKSKSQRRIGFEPEFLIGAYWARLDWENSYKVEFITNRIGPNQRPNPLQDRWAFRSQLDLYPFREPQPGWNLPFYTAFNFDSQFRIPSEVISLKAPLGQDGEPVSAELFRDPATFRSVKAKKLNGEFGLRLTNFKKTRWFRAGYLFGRDLNRISQVSVSGIAGTDSAQAAPGGIVEVMNGLNQQAALAEQALPFPGGVEFGSEISVNSLFEHGIAFAGEFSREFMPWENEGRKLKLTARIKDGRFFFLRRNDTSAQTRLRLELQAEARIPVLGNLEFVPGLEYFVFRSKPDPAVNEQTQVQTFQRLRPYFKLEYKFDFKPAFMHFWDALQFRNGGGK